MITDDQPGPEGRKGSSAITEDRGSEPATMNSQRQPSVAAGRGSGAALASVSMSWDPGPVNKRHQPSVAGARGSGTALASVSMSWDPGPVNKRHQPSVAGVRGARPPGSARARQARRGWPQDNKHGGAPDGPPQTGTMSVMSRIRLATSS